MKIVCEIFVVLRAKSHAVFNDHTFFTTSKHTQNNITMKIFLHQNVVSTFIETIYTQKRTDFTFYAPFSLISHAGFLPPLHFWKRLCCVGCGRPGKAGR
jgi:hypothetical protein